MSIIHDALKKAQDKLGEQKKRFLTSAVKPTPSQESPTPTPVKVSQTTQTTSQPINSIANSPQPPPTTVTTTTSNQQSSSRQQLPTGFILGITLLFAVILIYALSQTGTKPPAFQTPTTSPEPALTVKPLANFPAKLVLGGTVILGNKRAAIINDEIYETGGIVDGKKIISISLEKVELQDERGNIFTLTPK